MPRWFALVLCGAGATVDVWFDPGDPGQAVLERGVGRLHVYVIVAIGLAIAGAGLFALSR